MISPSTVGGLLYSTSQRVPDHTAVVFPNCRENFGELQQHVDEWARRLIGLGVVAGDHVGLSMTNAPEVIHLTFAICSVGAVAVPFNPRYRAEELTHVVENSDVSVLVVGPPPAEDLDLLGRALQALPGVVTARNDEPLRLAEAPVLRWVVSLRPSSCPGVLDLSALDATRATLTVAELAERYARTLVRSPAMIIYTSGTTARPKGAVLSHEAMVRTATSLALDRYRLTPDDRLWDPLPLFHMSGLLPLLACVAARCAFLSMPRVDAAEGLAMMRDERATVAFVAFAQLAMEMLGQPGYRPADLQSLRIVHTTGVPEVLGKVQAAFPQAVQVNPYGCTEVGGMCATSELTDTAEQRATFSGRPYPGLEVRVVDEGNVPRPTGQRGEIAVRGYSLFDGYYGNLEATAAVVDSNGWFHTGDLGELDVDGRVRYVSRLKDMLKVGGENVACVEIEGLLCGHPAVAIVCVVGVPHERLSEVPVAFVELVPGAVVTEEELISYCTGRIASFKVPTQIHLVTEWPMSATKIQKHKLRATLVPSDADFAASS